MSWLPSCERVHVYGLVRRTSMLRSFKLAPMPLAGEGLGERGMNAKAPGFPPLPNPSPARGEGLKSLRFGCGSWVGSTKPGHGSPPPLPGRGWGRGG